MTDPFPTSCRERFRPEHKLGEGGQGVVWLARQLSLDRAAVVKVARHGSCDEEGIRRFVAEARLTATLNHPNIVKVYDCGDDAGSVWIAYEYLTGRALSEVLERDGPMAWPLASRLCTQLASALGEAHRHGIIHRDVKPANVLVVSPERVVLMDFGLARLATGVSVTATGQIVGTPAYFAPEMMRDGEPAPGVDVYALGVTLHEMLLGRLPAAGTLTKGLDERTAGELPAAAAAILKRALQPDPAERYADGAAMSAALEEASRARFARTRGGAPRRPQSPGPVLTAPESRRMRPLVAFLAIAGALTFVLVSSRPSPGPSGVPAAPAFESAGTMRDALARVAAVDAEARRADPAIVADRDVLGAARAVSPGATAILASLVRHLVDVVTSLKACEAPGTLWFTVEEMVDSTFVMASRFAPDQRRGEIDRGLDSLVRVFSAPPADPVARWASRSAIAARDRLRGAGLAPIDAQQAVFFEGLALLARRPPAWRDSEEGLCWELGLARRTLANADYLFRRRGSEMLEGALRVSRIIAERAAVLVDLIGPAGKEHVYHRRRLDACVAGLSFILEHPGPGGPDPAHRATAARLVALLRRSSLAADAATIDPAVRARLDQLSR